MEDSEGRPGWRLRGRAKTGRWLGLILNDYVDGIASLRALG